MTYLTGLVPAVVGAAGAAYLGNRLLFRLAGRQAAVAAVPWWEEACKFAATLLVPGVPMLFVHVLFGSVEFGYDWWRSANHGLFLGVMSLAAGTQLFVEPQLLSQASNAVVPNDYSLNQLAYQYAFQQNDFNGAAAISLLLLIVALLLSWVFVTRGGLFERA